MTITGTFKRVSDDTAVDPGSVTAKTKNLDEGTVTSYVYGTDDEVSKSATGTYKLTFVPGDDGDWLVQFEGDEESPVAAVNQERFTVLPAI